MADAEADQENGRVRLTAISRAILRGGILGLWLVSVAYTFCRSQLHPDTARSHLRHAGAVVAGNGLRIVVAVSQPLSRGSIDPLAIVVRTADGEVIPGRVGFDYGNWWLTWFPEGALPAATGLRVTVSVPGATDWAGTDLSAASLFTFHTAGGSPG